MFKLNKMKGDHAMNWISFSISEFNTELRKKKFFYTDLQAVR